MKGDFKKIKIKRGKKGKITFDEEVISKDQAETLLSEQNVNPIKPNNLVSESNGETEYKTQANSKKRRRPDNSEGITEKSKPKKKQNIDNQKSEHAIDTIESSMENESTPTQELSNQPKKESNRAKKRQKHAKLLEEKKLNTEVQLQQKALNYLSKWKHSKSEWKFEKLKQVWLQTNLFDTSKIPNEFWETTVEYFSGAKGQSRQAALDNALKIIENEEGNSEENLDEDYQTKLKRARDIVQYLQ